MLIRMYKPSAGHRMQVCAIFCTLYCSKSFTKDRTREQYSDPSALSRQLCKQGQQTQHQIFPPHFFLLSFIRSFGFVLSCSCFFVYFLPSPFMNIVKTGKPNIFAKFNFFAKPREQNYNIYETNLSNMVCFLSKEKSIYVYNYSILSLPF